MYDLLNQFRMVKCTNGVQEMILTPFNPLFTGFLYASSTNWGSGGREFESLHPDHFQIFNKAQLVEVT